MKVKRFFYSVVLILFSLLLLCDLGLWLVVPDAEETAAETEPAFPSSEGMTRPGRNGAFEDMSLPEGMNSPDTQQGSNSRRRRSDRTGSEAETTFAEPGAAGTADDAPAISASAENAEEGTSTLDAVKSWLSAQVAKLQAQLPLAVLTPVKERVSPYRLHILLGAALGMVLCILRLIFLNRRIHRQEAAQDNPLSLKRVALWPALLLLLGALVLVAVLFPVNDEEAAEDGAVTNARVLSGTVTTKDLASLIQSAGALEEQEPVSLEYPASVTVESVCVQNGDLVSAGQIVAKADKTSVMQAIASVHEALDAIDQQLQEAHEAKGETTLSAPVAATVKAVYAQAGEAAMDVMARDGALMLLSLDGRMAVRIPAGELPMGASVTVTLSDGTELNGEVVFLEEGVATVTVVDRGYAVGEEVFVKDASGALLGSGPLSVHKALTVTGYLGTITRVYRAEGSTVSAGTALIGLSNTANLAEYSALLQQRAKYEQELQTLFELYEDGYLHAPCDGVIAGLSDKLTYASLSDMVAGLTVRRLASGPADADPGEYVNYLGTVTGTDGSTLELESMGQVNLTSYASLPTPSGAMAGTYSIPGSVPIYQFSGGWGTISAAGILVGDKALFTFDQNGRLVWVIVEHTASSATPSPSPSSTPAPTPNGTPNPSGSPDAEGTPGPSGSPGSGGGHGGGGGGFSFGGRGGSAAGTPKPAYVIATAELCTVTPQERMLITVPIDELDVLSLSLGQTADLYLDALPGRGFTATVTKIDPEGVNGGGNTKYTLTLALDREEQLYPGMNGTVCFPRRTGAAVPTVPLAAVTEDGTRTIVYTAYSEETDALLSPVEVQTGISDGTDVEILSGLAPGDVYYYRYADAISYVTDVIE